MGRMSDVDIMLRNKESVESMARTFFKWNTCKCESCKERGIRGYADEPYTMEKARKLALGFKTEHELFETVDQSKKLIDEHEESQ